MPVHHALMLCSLHTGCLPVLINDFVEPVFHGLVDWEAFSVRVPQHLLHRLPDILLAYSHEQIEAMQRALAAVWTRWDWTGSYYLFVLIIMVIIVIITTLLWLSLLLLLLLCTTVIISQ
jgi:hypothetical protein